MVESGGLAGSLTVPTDVPYFRLIIDDLRRRIASGEWPPGHQLPSTVQLLEMYRQLYGVKSLATVRKAIDILREEDVLRGHQGVAVYVADRPR